MISATRKHTSSVVAHRVSVPARTSIEGIIASARAPLMFAVLVGALTLVMPAAASGQSISPERALLNRSSSTVLAPAVQKQSDREAIAGLSRDPSGEQALLGRFDRKNVRSARTSAIARSPNAGVRVDGAGALLGRVRRPEGSSGGSKS